MIYLTRCIEKTAKEIYNNPQKLINHIRKVESGIAFVVGYKDTIFDCIFFGNKAKSIFCSGCKVSGHGNLVYKSRKQQDKIVFIITHETLHRVLLNVIRINDETLDNVDAKWGISEYNL